MQAERVRICSQRIMSKGVTSSWLVPLTSDASVDDVLALFAQYLLVRQEPSLEYPILKTCFETLLNEKEECMFVFMRRGVDKAVGILRSTEPLCTVREEVLLEQLGTPNQWNVPLWTWEDSDNSLSFEMEKQCPDHKVYMGIWCYR
jgi:hypothetical protein